MDRDELRICNICRLALEPSLKEWFIGIHPWCLVESDRTLNAARIPRPGYGKGTTEN